MYRKSIVELAFGLYVIYRPVQIVLSEKLCQWIAHWRTTTWRIVIWRIPRYYGLAELAGNCKMAECELAGRELADCEVADCQQC